MKERKKQLNAIGTDEENFRICLFAAESPRPWCCEEERHDPLIKCTTRVLTLLSASLLKVTDENTDSRSDRFVCTSAHSHGTRFCASSDIAHSADAEILETTVGHMQRTHKEDMMDLFVSSCLLAAGTRKHTLINDFFFCCIISFLLFSKMAARLLEEYHSDLFHVSCAGTIEARGINIGCL